MTIPDLTPVTSSHVEAIGYAEGFLYVRFLHGKGSRTYRYDRVQADEHAAIMAADSQGKALQPFIKNAERYPCEKMPEQVTAQAPHRAGLIRDHTKRAAIDDPESCWNKTPDHMPIFVIVAKDETSAATIRDWILRNPQVSPARRQDAVDCALACSQYPEQKAAD